jgi:transposase
LHQLRCLHFDRRILRITIRSALQMRILVAVERVDFRVGIDGLVRLCRERLQADPFAGGLFVFRSRRETAIRIICYDSC